MKIAIVYVGIAAIGYIIAAFLTSKKNSFTWIGKALSIIVTFLIFLMGFRIGENEEVVGNIGSIGLQSLIMAVVSLAIAILAMTGVRRLIGYDKYAMVKGDKSIDVEEEQKTEKAKGRFLSKSTIRYLIAVIVGFVLGYVLVIKTGALSFESASSVTAILVTYGLYAMVFLVGMDMGFDGSFVKVFKSAGLRALAIPVTTALATLASMFIMSFFVDLGAKEMACIGCTFGWYSLGPNIIMEAGMITAGAYAFLVNFFRDMICFMIIPWVANTFGYVETIPLPQAASMDLLIATIEGATNKATTALAFFSGVLFTITVPIILPIIAG